MIKKHKQFLIFFTIILLFFLSAGFSYALEVQDYPRIPFTQPLTQDSDLPQYVNYFFALGIYLAGAIAVISLAVGGVQLIFSSVNPEARNNAIDRIKGAILGIVLTLASFIILRTINPTLISPSLTPLGETAGIFYTNGSDKKPAPNSESNTSSIPAGYNTIIYKCAQGAYSPALLILKFPQTNFGGYRDATVVRLNCEQSAIIDSSSFKIIFETPGVYYFIKEGCKGYMSQVNTSNTEQIGEPFRSEMRSIKIVNDGNLNYGVILHKDVNFRGDCIHTYQAQGGDNCFNLAPPISSINIFVQNSVEPKTSGNGVVFYSKPFGYKTGANSGYLKISPDNIGTSWQGNAADIDFRDSYNYVDVPQEEKNLCTNFKKCPGSIKVQGNYLVVLWARQIQSQYYYCQVFYKDIPNLKEEEVTAVEGRALEYINVIPIK